MSRRAVTLDDLRGSAREQATLLLAQQAVATAKRQQKYGAEPTVVDGIRFASKFEARHYGELLQRRAAGEIIDLEIHPVIHCVVNGLEVCRYIGDFGYTEVSTGKRVLADTKGVLTDVYKLKKKLVKACHGIDILEIKRR